MAAAKRKAEPGDQLRIEKKDGVSEARWMADVSIDPAASAAATSRIFSTGTFGETGISETLEALQHSVSQVRAGDMSGPESMLVAQATSLNLIFTELARRSALNMGEYIEASEKYMRLALKAQAQCRATIETLASIKNPTLVIAKQANISAGAQQVNNGPAPARAEVSDNRPNELLEHQHEQRLDLGTTAAPGRGDPKLVAVGAGHRTQDARRQGSVQP